MDLIDKIIADIDSWKEGAFSVNSMVDSPEVFLRGKLHGGAFCVCYLKRGQTVLFRSSSKNSTLDGSHEGFALIASKGKKEIGASFVLINERDQIIFSSDQRTNEDVTGLFWISFGDGAGLYSILLSVYIDKDGLNDSNLIIDADTEHRGSVSRLVYLAYQEGAEHNG